MQAGDNETRAQFGEAGQALDQAALCRALVEHSQDIISLIAPDGAMRYVSPAVRHVLGYEPEELVGHTIYAYIHPDDVAPARTNVQAMIEQGQAQGSVLRLRAKNGGWHWLESDATNLLHDPAVGAIVLTSREVTQQQQLLQTMHFQANVLQQVHEAVIAIDLDEKIIYWNEAAEELLQVPREAVLGRHRDEVYEVRWLDEVAATAARARAWRTGGGWQGEKIVRVKQTGVEVYTESTVSLLRDAGGQRTGWIATMRDIRERKAAEAALRLSEERFRTSVEALMDGFAIMRALRDEAGQIVDFQCVYINEAGCRLSGKSRADTLAHTGVELYPDQMTNGLFQNYVRVVETGQPMLLESFAYTYENAPSMASPAYLDIQLVKFDDGFVAAWRDVTDRQQTVDDLREREERFRRIFEDGPLGIVLADLEGNALQVNARFGEILGYAPEAMAGLNYAAVTHPDDLPYESAFVEPVASGQVPSRTLEKRYIHQDGHLIWASVTITVLRDAHGRPQFGLAMVQDISERKESEAMLRQIVEGAHCLLWTAEVQQVGEHLEWSLHVPDVEAAARFLPVECARDEEWSAAWHRSRMPEDAHRCNQHSTRAVQQGQPGYKQEYRCRLEAGSIRWLVEDVRIVPVAAGHWQLVGVCIDITERKRAEAHQTRLTSGLEIIVEAADELLMSPDLDTLLRRGVELPRERLGIERCALFLLNEEQNLICGTYGTDMQGRTTHEQANVFPNEGLWAATIQAAAQAAHTPTKDGTAAAPRWQYVTARPYMEWKEGRSQPTGGSGWIAATPLFSIAGVLGVFLNDTAITAAPLDPVQQELLVVYGSLLGSLIERQRAATQMRESEERYRQLVELSPDAVLVHDTETILFANSAAAQLLRAADVAALQGLSLFRFIRPERHAASRQNLPRMLQGDTLRHIEAKLTRLDGSVVEIEYAGSPITYQGRPAMLSVVRDVTERQRMLQSLRESQQRFSQIFHASPIGISITTLDEGRVIDVNESLLQLFGRTREEMMGKTSEQVGAWVSQEDRDRFLAALRRDETLHEYELDVRRPNGQIRSLVANAIVMDLNGQRCVLSLARDMTEQRRLMLELKAYADKLERSNRELQEFAYVASHDLQEPLRKIQTFGDRLKTRHSDQLDEAGQDYLQRMQSAATRMNTLIQDLLTLSRISTQGRPFVAVNLEAVVQGVLSDLELRIEQTGAHVEVGSLPEIQADRAQMNQLFLNLINNALKFHRPGLAPAVQVHSEILEATGACRITVQDNGIGFDPHQAERIFLPFQRLVGRSEYEGTGMGLAICRRIVERHGGTITAASEPGVGTTFTVTLPMQH